MKQRTQWLSIEGLTAPVMRRLIDFLRGEAAYSGRVPHGVLVRSVRSREVSGICAERVSKEATFVDPLGETYTSVVTEVRVATFSVSMDRPELEVGTTNRIPHALGKMINRGIGDDAVLAPITVDPIAWVSALEKLAKLRAEVQQVDFAQVEVASDAVGAMRVIGERDVREAASRWLGRRRHRVQKIVATLHGRSLGGVPVVCVLERTGRVRVDAAQFGDIRPHLRAALAAAVDDS